MQRRIGVGSWTAAVAALLVVAGMGCGEAPGEEPSPWETRGAGKADLAGSCQGHCGSAEASPDGCWCDEACARYGDCCSDKSVLCDGEAPPSAAPPAPPVANDPRYAIEGARAWYLIGDPLTPGAVALELTVRPPTGTKLIDAWLDGGAGVRLTRKGTEHRYQLKLHALASGEHTILLAADGAATAFAELRFQRSHALYVSVTNDWDDPDNPDPTLARQEKLHARHPALRLTHFVGPYTFTDPSVSDARADRLVGWLKGLQQQYRDEIGLHIHPYCSFVTTAKLGCRTAPSFAYASGDSTGYTVNLDAYSEEEMLTLLQAAEKIFGERGLGKPTSFRAGGWTAGLHTLKALGRAGFLADGSGCNWSRLEEWKGYSGASLYAWNQQNWTTIGDTSQPYHPSTTDPLASGSPQLPVLEVPDNGLLVDYVTAAEMIAIFKLNWPGGALAVPRVVSIGYHPPNFSESFFQRIDAALSHVDQFLHSADRGPVVYATMSELAKVYPAN